MDTTPLSFSVRPVATVHNTRTSLEDDNWGSITSTIELTDEIPSESLDGIESFSHVEIFFIFHKIIDEPITDWKGHPRGNPDWEEVGIFAMRKKRRMNFIGSTIVPLIERKERALIVRNLDAIDETPVVDIKPVMRGFLPDAPITQPSWADALMQNYWKKTL